MGTEEKVLKFWDMFGPVCLLSQHSQSNCEMIAKSYFPKFEYLDFDILYEVFQDFADDPEITNSVPQPWQIKKRYYQRLNAIHQQKDEILAGPESPERIKKRAEAEFEARKKIAEITGSKNDEYMSTYNSTGCFPVGYCIGLWNQDCLKTMRRYSEKTNEK